MEMMSHRTATLPGVTVLGKIDLSQFSKPRQVVEKIAPVKKEQGKKRSGHTKALKSGFVLIRTRF